MNAGLARRKNLELQRRLFDDMMLPEICMYLRVGLPTSEEPGGTQFPPLMDERVKETVAFLQDRLDCWHPSSGNRRIFDGAVSLMMISVIGEVRELRPHLDLSRDLLSPLKQWAYGGNLPVYGIINYPNKTGDKKDE